MSDEYQSLSAPISVSTPVNMPRVKMPTAGMSPFRAGLNRVMKNVSRKKTVADIQKEMLSGVSDGHGSAAPSPSGQILRVLGWMDLTAFGISSTVGAGVYVIVGVAAANSAGPALILSFLVAAVACLFSGLCYCEFATRVPIAGSAYTYAYATMGELMGWFIGWNLTLEYGISASAVARAWAG